MSASPKKAELRAIIFDFGGTLDTDGVHWSEKFWEVYQKLGIPVLKPDFERAFVAGEQCLSKEAIAPSDSLMTILRKQAHHQITYLADNGQLGNHVDVPRLEAAISGECYADVTRCISEAAPLLKRLAERYRLALVSNFTGNLEAVCEELGIRRFFAIIVDSAIVGAFKPDPLIFQLALERLLVPPVNCLVIGDSYDRDIVPAKALGCLTTLLLKKSWKEPETTEAADFRISTLSELPGVIEFITLPG
jgi:HAD superfamily hydrolase (TIGR01509 family)